MMKYLSRSEELILLAVWRLQENAYCVPIRKQLSEVTGKEWSFGAIYVPLSRLEKKGFLKSSFSAPESKRGGRSKRFYRVTAYGLKALAKARELQKDMWAGIPEFSLK